MTNNLKASKMILTRLKNRLARTGDYLAKEWDYRKNGLPSEELDWIKMYYKTRRPDRYLLKYANPGIKRVVIQIGMDKTASTAIQEFLHANRDLLHTYSIEYRTDWGDENHSTPLKAIMARQPEKIYPLIVLGMNRAQIDVYNVKNLMALCRGIQACQQETYVFYGEGICSFEEGEYQKLLDFLNVLMPEAKVEIWYCTRSNIGYASSAHQQAVRLGRCDSPTEQVAIASSLYQNRLNNAIQIFGKEQIQVYPFEETIRHAYGPVGFFLERLGVPREGMASIHNTRTNESVSFQAIEIMEHINKKHPMVWDGVKHPMRMRNDTAPIMKISGPRYQVSNNRMQQILKEAGGDIEWLKENFGIEYPMTHQPMEEIIFSYDDAYGKECMQAYRELNDFLKNVFYGFILEKCHGMGSSHDQAVFQEIRKGMEEQGAGELPTIKHGEVDDEKSLF